MSRETIASLGAALSPLVLIVLAAVAARLAALGAKHIRDKRFAAAVELAAYGAAGVVADLAQHVVDALKDPSKPGTWDQVAANAVRETAITRVRSLYPGAVQVLTSALQSTTKVDELLGTLVERAVRDLKGRASPAHSADVLPDAISPRDAQRGAARMDVMLCVLALVALVGTGALLVGCRPPADCEVGHDTWRCSPEGVPQFCDAHNRWRAWATLPCARSGGQCAVREGRATCVAAPADGGAR